MSLLLYQTDDDEFADRVVESLHGADIACHRWGVARGLATKYLGYKGLASIYIEHESDAEAATKILIELGAAQGDPPVVPGGWKTFWLTTAALLIACALIYWLII